MSVLKYLSTLCLCTFYLRTLVELYILKTNKLNWEKKNGMTCIFGCCANLLLFFLISQVMPESSLPLWPFFLWLHIMLSLPGAMYSVPFWMHLMATLQGNLTKVCKELLPFQYCNFFSSKSIYVNVKLIFQEPSLEQCLISWLTVVELLGY